MRHPFYPTGVPAEKSDGGKVESWLVILEVVVFVELSIPFPRWLQPPDYFRGCSHP